MGRPFLIVALLIYGVLVVVTVVSMQAARRRALQNLSSKEAQRDWQAWREEARRQSKGAGPVKRSVPASEEPPELVLLRDYYAASLSTVLAFGSLTYAVFVFFLHGALSGNAKIDDGSANTKREATN